MNKKLLLSAIAAGSLMIAVSSAQADAVATSYLNVYDFALTDSVTGNKLVVGTDVNFVGTVTNNGDTSAELVGIGSDGHSNALPASAAGLDIQAACVLCTYTENSFSYLTKPSVGTSTYALGDALLTGAIVDFPGQPVPDANAKTLAEISITREADGTANGNNVGVQGQFTFIANRTATIDIDFLADAYVRAMLTNDVTGGSADASISWSINIVNAATQALVLRYSPDFINTGRSATVPGNDFEYSQTGLVGAASFGVVLGQNYQITIDHASDANANQVPAPAPLALMGLGLLGLVWTRKRNKN